MSSQTDKKQPCCSTVQVSLPCCDRATAEDTDWVEGWVETPVGPVPRVTTKLTWADRTGSWKARWGIGRMNYTVQPGLYAVGSPGPDAPVLVSANYKMSFDRLRQELGDLDVWVLVLDTRGINVWCAAGKGTFGTDEIVAQIEATRLAEALTGRTLIVPQLGAPGVCAHEVKQRSDFRVAYGPVRAADIPAFLEAGMKATPEMRRVRFTFRDRVVLIPVELVIARKYVLLLAATLFLLSGLGRAPIYAFDGLLGSGLASVALLLAGVFAGVALVPALLPCLPGRSFSAKGAWVGGAMVVLLAGLACAYPGRLVENWIAMAGWVLLIPAIASFLAMNFTGASTYTSLSGVRREMRVAVPLQIAGAVLGLGLWLVGRFV